MNATDQRMEPNPAPQPSETFATLPQAPLGVKRIGRFTACLWCGDGTWVRYGGLPTCPSCAQPRKAKAHLWRLLDTWATMDETAMTESVLTGQPVPVWTAANVKALNEDIMAVFNAHAEATEWFREWRAAHPEAKLP